MYLVVKVVQWMNGNDEKYTWREEDGQAKKTLKWRM